MADKPRVARYQADRTNQKFYFCRLACVEADKAVDKQQYQAHCETAIFHLHGAYLAFLQELAHFYNLDTTSPSLTSIETGLASKTLVSPEIERLKQSKEQGILANVLNAFKRCQYAPTPERINHRAECGLNRQCGHHVQSMATRRANYQRMATTDDDDGGRNARRNGGVLSPDSSIFNHINLYYAA